MSEISQDEEESLDSVDRMFDDSDLLDRKEETKADSNNNDNY